MAWSAYIVSSNWSCPLIGSLGVKMEAALAVLRCGEHLLLAISFNEFRKNASGLALLVFCEEIYRSYGVAYRPGVLNSHCRLWCAHTKLPDYLNYLNRCVSLVANTFWVPRVLHFHHKNECFGTFSPKVLWCVMIGFIVTHAIRFFASGI